MCKRADAINKVDDKNTTGRNNRPEMMSLRVRLAALFGFGNRLRDLLGRYTAFSSTLIQTRLQ